MDEFIVGFQLVIVYYSWRLIKALKCEVRKREQKTDFVDCELGDSHCFTCTKFT